jgi:hypothetical protein
MTKARARLSVNGRFAAAEVEAGREFSMDFRKSFLGKR